MFISYFTFSCSVAHDIEVDEDVVGAVGASELNTIPFMCRKTNMVLAKHCG